MKHTHNFIPTIDIADKEIFGALHIARIPEGSLPALTANMAEFGILLPCGPDATLEILQGREGGERYTAIDLRGQGVRGYLVDLDGLEVCIDQIRRWLRASLPCGAILTIHGSHTIAGMIQVDTRIDVSIEEEGVIHTRNQDMTRTSLGSRVQVGA